MQAGEREKPVETDGFLCNAECREIQCCFSAALNGLKEKEKLLAEVLGSCPVCHENRNLFKGRRLQRLVPGKSLSSAPLGVTAVQGNGHCRGFQ